MYGNYNNPYNNQRSYYPYYSNNVNEQPRQMPIQPLPMQNTNIGLLGKLVDSVDVVKAIDIPLDGSISYFPLTNGTAIITKQLQNDGTSKTIIYKPIEENMNEAPSYVTFDDLKKELSKIDLTDIEDLKDELKELKKELKTIKKNKED